MNEKESDLKNVQKDPTTTYVENPNVRSKSELIAKQKAGNVRVGRATKV